ncbi:hypothetical protein [Paenibacillus hexagrammi]|nr:hypothetical protein [Paenibacillus sp. YPD9-1]
MGMNAFLRQSILGIANNRVIHSWFRKYGLASGVSRFVAGNH